MRLQEARQILDLSKDATPEEAKKKYRSLAAKMHPDVNKEPDAEEKFKKINEAYECIKSGKDSDQIGRQSHQGYSPFNPFGQQVQQIREVNNIDIHLAISFKESILGCKKEVKYSRHTKCSNCEGQGEIKLHNGCVKCGGKGQITQQHRGVVMVSTCTSCYGRSQTESCANCQGEGSLETETNIQINVPAGIHNGNALRLQGMGNYAGSFMGSFDQSTDVYCHLKVEEDEDLQLEETDVVSHLSLHLLDALTGCTMNIKTIFGHQDIQIPAGARNKEEVIIPKMGVAGTGNQRVILNISYPSDVSKLIEAMKN